MDNAPRQQQPAMVTGAMAPEDSQHHVGAYVMRIAIRR